MSASPTRTRRRPRHAWIFLLLALSSLTGCAGGDVQGPDASSFQDALFQSPPGSEANWAVQFDGRDDRIDLDPASVGTPASLTVELWLRIDQSNKIHMVVSNTGNDFNDGFTVLVNQTNQVQFSVVRSNRASGTAVSVTALDVGTWYHVAGTYDAQGGTVKVYVNGVEQASADYSSGITYANNRDLRFGTQIKSYKRNERFLKGAIDEVRIWERARSAEEIGATMDREISGGENGLVGYWRLNEGEGNTTADLSNGATVSSVRNGELGVLQGGPIWIPAADWRVESLLQLTIVVKPGEDDGQVKQIVINPGKLPVAILSTADFSAPEQVDANSLTFGHSGDEASLHYRGNGLPNCGPEDVNGDELPDLACRFITELTGLRGGDTEAFLKGVTTDGVALSGSDEVSVREKTGR
jgi:hypothetical protein